MTIAEPDQKTLEEVDWETLDALTARARELFVRANATGHPVELSAWRALWAEAVRATNGHEAQLDTLRLYVPRDAWEPET